MVFSGLIGSIIIWLIQFLFDIFQEYYSLYNRMKLQILYPEPSFLLMFRSQWVDTTW